MSFEQEHARLHTGNGEPVVLEGVTASGDLSGMLLDMRIEQRFRNPGSSSLEVVYTFPLPWRAVLLGVDVRLGERQLSGAVVAKAQAAQGYEDALAGGDAAVMLEVNADHSYSLNLGNLAPGEACVISLRYAQLLQVEQGKLRLLIPTVIAPRYGDPVRDGGMQPHQTVAYDMRARYPFDLTIHVHGDLSRLPVASPTHPIRVIAATGLLTVSLATQGMLDRDFVLTLDEVANASHFLRAPDSLQPDHYMVMASFCPVLPPRRNTGISAAVLVDCSGSMAGDSIGAARSALHEVLGQMVAGDRFSLSRFGSHVEHRSRGMWPFNGATLASARQWTERLAADLGGTEMEQALTSTFALAKGSSTDVLLITDGEISAIDSTLDSARRSGHRVFVVGIGSSVAETHLRRLAQESGGACDFLAPGEAAAPAIVRMFARMRAPSISAPRVRWPDDEAPLWTTALPAHAFEGDTLHVFALLRNRPSGMAALFGKVAGNDALSEIALAMPSEDQREDAVLPRVAAATRIHGTSHSDDSSDTTAFAVAYQLVTPHTSFLLIHERADHDKAHDMPALHKVGQMVPAGWGGVGSVNLAAGSAGHSSSLQYSSSSDMFGGLKAPAAWRHRSPAGSSNSDPAAYDIPAFLRKASAAFEPEQKVTRSPFDACDPAHWIDTGEGAGFTPLGFGAWLNEQPASRWPRTYADLESAGMSKGVVEWLRRELGMEREETLIVNAFCTAMAGMDAGHSKHPGGAMVIGGPLHEAVFDDAVKHIQSAIELAGANRWPLACLQM